VTAEDAAREALEGSRHLMTLIGIYLDGFTSGVSSTLQSLASDVPAERRDAYAQDFANSIYEDPIGRDAIVTEIAERVAGVDTGAKDLGSVESAAYRKRREGEAQ
jgi:hypothetical protein